ncbi:hypothetical protein D3C75_1228910 [compost metagenome]
MLYPDQFLGNLSDGRVVEEEPNRYVNRKNLSDSRSQSDCEKRMAPQVEEAVRYPDMWIWQHFFPETS